MPPLNTKFFYNTFKVINEFKKDRFISYINEKGEVLGTKSPLLSLSTDAVASPQEAYNGFTLDEKHIKQIFGNIPGVSNKSAITKPTGKPKVEDIKKDEPKEE